MKDQKAAAFLLLCAARKEAAPSGTSTSAGVVARCLSASHPDACTACARFRGFRRDMVAENVRLSGLGSLAEYLRESDRFITFGD